MGMDWIVQFEMTNLLQQQIGRSPNQIKKSGRSMSPIDNHDTGKSRWIPANRGNNRSSKWLQLYVDSPKLIETTIRDSFLDLL